MKKAIYIAVLLLTGSSFSLKAQTYHLNSAAYASGSNCYIMTDEVKNRKGSVWFAQKLDLRYSFDIEFTMNFGRLDAAGADGMTFALQAVGTTAIGTTGGSFGYDGIPNSFAVEFDTYHNNSVDDPTYDHIAIISKGDVDHGAVTNIAGPVAATASQANIEDSLDHTIHIIWKAPSDSIYVYFDCQLRIATKYDIIDNIFSGNPSVWWGFTGGTGGSMNKHGVCVVQNVSSLLKDTTKCAADTLVLSAPAGTNYTWTPATGISNTSIVNPEFYPTSTTRYYVNYNDNCGIARKDSATITVSPLTVNLGADTVLCSGQSVTLNAGSFNSYLWQNGATTQAITVSSTGTYWVRGQSAGGCSASDTIAVTVSSPPSLNITPPSPAICRGESISLVAGGGSTYSWGPSSGLSATTGSSVNANPTNTTTYTVTGTDVNGCSNTTNVTVTVRSLPAIGITPASPAICIGKSVALTASGGNTYIWNPSTDLSASTGTTVTANPTANATYTVTGTDNNGCSNTADITVSVNSLPTIGVLPATPAICSGKSVSLNANGGSTYTWSPSLGLSASTGSSVSASPVTTSTYTVTGTNSNGCSNTASVTVTVDPLPSINVVPASPAICNGQSVSLDASGGIIYTWSPSAGLSASAGSSVTANPSGTSTYTVTGTDGNGCSNTASATVTVNALPTIGVLPASPGFCAGQSVALNAQGGSAYTWNPSGGLSATTGASVTADPASTSTYTVTGTDANGCSNTSSVTVTVHLLPAIGVTPSSPSVCSGKSVTLTASGGSSYAWSPSTGLSSTSGVSVSANPSGTSTYTVTGTDGNGCTATTGVTVTVNTLPDVSVLPASPSLCAGASVALNASGGSSYTWSPSSGLSATTGASVNASPSSTATYIVTGTDGNGCSGTSSVTVTVNPLPSVTVLPASPAICSGKSVTLDASGGTTFTWSPSSGLSATSGSSVTANPSGTSAYIVTGTDGNGCSNTSSVTVTVNSLPVIGVSPATPVICNGQSVALNAGGGNSYAWSPSSGLSATTGTSVTASPSGTSTYIVTGTDGNGCSNTSSVTVTVNALPAVSVLPAAPAICNGASIALNAGGGSSYTWSPASGLSASTGTPVTANPSATSTYIVTGTDGNGCSNTSSVTVTVNDLPVVLINPATPVICNGQSVSLNASGAGTYTWSPASGLSATTGSSVTANPAATSSYVVTGTDGNGCTNTASITVTVQSSLTIQITPASTAICNGQSTSLTASGANTFSWSPSTGLSATGGSAVTANPSSTMTYKVVGAAGSCNNSTTVTVTVNSLPSVSVLPVAPAICSGSSIALTANGGNSYTWNPASDLSANSGASVNANPSTTATYVVTGTDGNGCSNTSSVTVTVNALPAIGILPASPSICTGSAIGLAATGGNSYIWSPGSGLSGTTGASVSASPSSTSSYVVTGTDGNGCSSTSIVTVTVNTLPAISVFPPAPAVCSGNAVSLAASGASSYIWSPGTGLSSTTGTSVNAGPAGTSTYIVSGTDGNGCSNTSTVTVTVNTLPVIGVTPASPEICAGNSVALTASGGDTYAWSPAGGLSAATGTSVNAGPATTSSYLVTGTDGNGCSNTSNVTVTVNLLPDINAGPDLAVCSGDSAVLTITGDPAGSTYGWSPATGLSCTGCNNPKAAPASSTDYIITVTDPSGCSGSDTVNVNLQALPISVNQDTTVCYGSFIQLNASGGASYLWSPSTGLSDSTIADPLAFLISTTSYTVTASSGNCASDAVVTVIVYPAPAVPLLAQSNDTLYCTSDPSYVSYQWYFDNLPIAGATSRHLHTTQSGNYNIAITDVNGCVVSAGINIILTSIAKTGRLPIYIYPNPADSYILINQSSVMGPLVSVRLFNALGEQVLAHTYTHDWNGRLDISKLSSGMYSIRLSTADKEWHGRFTKN